MPGEGLEPSSLTTRDFESRAVAISPPRQWSQCSNFGQKINFGRCALRIATVADIHTVPPRPVPPRVRICRMNPPASQFFSDSIFWIDIDKVRPNPFQPRKEFDELRLKDLAESIRMYGILQPLVVTRKEVVKADGGLSTEYELISGERRLRASKLAGLSQVPTLIRASEESVPPKIPTE